MPKFLCKRLINDDSFYFTETKSIGKVDIHNHNSDTEFEINAIKESMNKNGIFVNLEVCPRITTIVDAKDEKDAFKKSELVFEEALDCFDMYGQSLNETFLVPIGYIINLDTFNIYPLNKDFFETLKTSPIFHRFIEDYLSVNEFQYILSNPNRREIDDKIVRASHWIRQAKIQKNEQMKFLFRWFAIETLAKEHEQEDIIPKIMLCLGLFTSKYTKIINPELQRAFRIQIPDYKEWKTRIEATLKEMRKYRNASVHNGHRIHDVTSEKLEYFLQISLFASSRMKGYYLENIFSNISTQSEIWKEIPKKVEKNENLINDTKNNFLYSLKNL